MTEVTVYGAGYSTYTRTVLLALAEKSVAWTLSEVDIFKPVPQEHLDRHPWGKIPVLEHDGFRVYETAAVTRYIDESFPGPQLQPLTARGRARMMQVIGLIDSYGYRPLIPELFVQRAVMPKFGNASDEAKIAAALPEAERVLDAIAAVQGSDPYPAGSFSLADLHLAPIFAYVTMTQEGAAMLASRPGLNAWWERVRARPSMAATRSPLEG
jgi:glutathione S-transferase